MTYTAMILKAAQVAHVSGALLLAICTHESGLRNQLVLNDKGSPSYGLCQLKLNSAQMVGFSGDGVDLMEPEINVRYAALYLKYQLDRYDDDMCLAMAAYNAGSYRESKKYPGKPRNLKYVREVSAKIADPIGKVCFAEDKKVVSFDELYRSF